MPEAHMWGSGDNLRDLDLSSILCQCFSTLPMLPTEL
uniref:Uncharacterized protein n=1 Tax=Trichinella nativa TaxID=6335 RepID=A0A0V1KIZ1_9BILA